MTTRKPRRNFAILLMSQVCGDWRTGDAIIGHTLQANETRYKKSELVKGVHGSLGNRVKPLMLNGVAWAGENSVRVRAQRRRG